MTWKESWKEFLESKEEVIQEITEDELEHIRPILDKMAEDEDALAFRELFGGKARLVIPFPTTDETTEAGKFISMWDQMGYNVDWEKGIVSGDKTFLGDGGFKTKKIQMKIGKWLAKVFEYATRIKEDTPGGHQSFKAKPYYKMLMQGNPRMSYYLVNPEEIEKLSKWWQENAAYLKKNIEDLTSGENAYSIIVSRHPIDVLRMADFKGLESCHSPPSRDGAEGEYYKCAVAESYGEGAVAYVVSTEDLLEETGTETIEEAESKIQDGEIFSDDKRPMDSGPIEPISRTRLRQVKSSEGIEIAVPEKRTYGKSIPGFGRRMLDWAKENQADPLRALPKKDGKYDLNQLTSYGGDYGDNNISSLLTRVLGTKDTVGFMRADTSTENSLEANLFDDVEEFSTQANEILGAFNYRYASVTFQIEDDEGGAYAVPEAALFVTLQKREFKRPPTKGELLQAAEEAKDELEAYEYPIGDDIRVDDGGVVVIRFPIEASAMEEFEGRSAFGDLTEFRTFCEKVDALDDLENDYSMFSNAIKKYLKLAGLMEGGVFQKWAEELNNDSDSYYEWKYEIEEEYENVGVNFQSISIEANDISIDMEKHANKDDFKIKWKDDVQSIVAYINNYPIARVYKSDGEYDFEVTDAPPTENVNGYYESFSLAKKAIDAAYGDPNKFMYDNVKKLLRTREFSIALKQSMCDPYKSVGGGMYPPNWRVKASKATHEGAGDGQWDIEVSMAADTDDPDGAIETMKAVVENWDDNDKFSQMVQKVADEIIKKFANPKEEANESKIFVSRWKDFLFG